VHLYLFRNDFIHTRGLDLEDNIRFEDFLAVMHYVRARFAKFDIGIV